MSNFNVWLEGLKVKFDGLDGLAIGDKCLSTKPVGGNWCVVVTGKPRFVYYFTFDRVLQPVDSDVKLFYLNNWLTVVKLPVNSSTFLWVEERWFGNGLYRLYLSQEGVKWLKIGEFID
jgi:hypothetical protein